MADEKLNAYADYQAGMKYKEIAEKYGVSLSTVKSWKTRYGWERQDTGKGTHKKTKKVCIPKQPSMRTKQLEKKLYASVDENETLTEEQRLFCLYYVTTHNALQSYLKAYGCRKEVAVAKGYSLLKKVGVQKEIKRLKEIMREEVDIGVGDLIRYCMKVVGADIGDYVQMINGLVMVTSGGAVDTSVIQEVKQTQAGIAIKLADKQWAWDKLEQLLGWTEVSAVDRIIIQDDIPEGGGADGNCIN